MPNQTLPAARQTPPDLNDESRFVHVPDVAIIDTHVRKHTRPDGAVGYSVLDDTQIERLFANTAGRVEAGEIPAVRLGHIVKFDAHGKPIPEHLQPPKVGYLSNFKMGRHNGRKAILADMFINKDCDLDERGVKPAAYVLDQFSRRSAEVFRKEEADGYIDAVALLTRTPERSLGLVTYGAKEDDIEIFECDDCRKEGGVVGGEGGDDDDDYALDDKADKSDPDPAREAVLEAVKSDEFRELLTSLIRDAVSGGGSVGGGSVPPPETGKKGEVENMASEENIDISKYDNAVVELGILKAQNERLATDNAALKSRLDAVELFAKEQQVESHRNQIRARLTGLYAKGVDLDVEEEMENFAGVDDAAVIDRRFKSIETRYGRRLDKASEIPTSRSINNTVVNPDAEDDMEALSAEEASTGSLLRWKNAHPEVKQTGDEDNISFGHRLIEAYKSAPDRDRFRPKKK